MGIREDFEDPSVNNAVTAEEIRREGIPEDGLGKLSQSARTNQLRSARTTMYVVGALTIVANLVFCVFAKNFVDSEIDAEVRKLQGQGLQVDMAVVNELKTQSVRATQVSTAGFAAMGVVFIVLGALVYRYPVPCTVLALVLYLAGQGMAALADPKLLMNGIIIKVIIIVALVKAVQAAMAYRREQLATGN